VVAGVEVLASVLLLYLESIDVMLRMSYAMRVKCCTGLKFVARPDYI
jgi:hypothetical protein